MTKQIFFATTISGFLKEGRLLIMQTASTWQGQYFLMGTAALTSCFAPLVSHTERHGNGADSATGGSCGPSFGSSFVNCGGGD
jgi:hypothetical protein